jgi:hypothetical protein
VDFGPGELLGIFARFVLDALAPEMYALECVTLTSAFADLHARRGNSFGAVSPFTIAERTGTESTTSSAAAAASGMGLGLPAGLGMMMNLSSGISGGASAVVNAGLIEHLLAPGRNDEDEAARAAEAAATAAAYASLSPRSFQPRALEPTTSMEELPIPAGPRWGGGGGLAAAAAAVELPSSSSLLQSHQAAALASYAHLYQLPPLASLLALLQLDRYPATSSVVTMVGGTFRPQQQRAHVSGNSASSIAVSMPSVSVLRSDLLCRKTLFDSALLHCELAALEHLSSLSLSSARTKVAAVAAGRLDAVRNDLREVALELPSASSAAGADAGVGGGTSGGGHTGGSSSSNSSCMRFSSVKRWLSAEREQVHLRIQSFVRFSHEAMLVKEDAKGVESVVRVLRIVRARGGCVAVQPDATMLPSPSSSSSGVLVSCDADVDSSAAMSIVPCHPRTPLHGVASLFQAFGPAEGTVVQAAFEGLGRELAQVNKLMFRLTKEGGGSGGGAPIQAPVAAATSAPPNGSTTMHGSSSSNLLGFGALAQQVPLPLVPEDALVLQAVGRAEHAVSCMRQALALAQMFDTFYSSAFEAEHQKRLQQQETQKVKSSAHNKPSASKRDVDSFIAAEQELWRLPSFPSLSNATAPLWLDAGLYMRALVPLTSYLAIIERTSHQSAALMAAAAAAPAHMATSLVMDAASLDSGVSQAFRPSMTTLSASQGVSSSGGGAGTLNSGTVFGFTLFALGLRPQDNDWIMACCASRWHWTCSHSASNMRAGGSTCYVQRKLQGVHKRINCSNNARTRARLAPRSRPLAFLGLPNAKAAPPRSNGAPCCRAVSCCSVKCRTRPTK